MDWFHVIFEVLFQSAEHAALTRTAQTVAVDKKLKRSRIIGWIALFLFLFGLFSTGYGIYFVSSGYASTNWPHVEGRVADSSLVDIPGRYGSSRATPVIHFDYSVDGVNYTGQRISFHWVTPPSQVGTYSPGRSFPVYYSPSNPSNSVLEPGITGGDLAFWSFAFTFMLWMSLAVYFMARKMRREALDELQQIINRIHGPALFPNT